MEWGGGKRGRKRNGKRENKNEKTYLSSTDNAFVLIVSETTLIAYPDQCRGAHVWVANRAFAIAFIAQTTDCYPRLFAAHYQIAVVFFFFFLVSQASKFEKKELESRGEDRGGGTYGWWRDILVACSRWKFCGCLKGGGLRNADLALMLDREISRTFQFNLSAKTRTSPFQDVSLVHSSKCRSKGERFCHLADLGDLAIWLCSHVRTRKR